MNGKQEPHVPAGPARVSLSDAAGRTHALAHDQRRARRPYTDRRLSRSKADRVLGGVCGGLARFIGVPSGNVRLVYGVSVLLSIGTTALLYLLLWLLIPANAETSA